MFRLASTDTHLSGLEIETAIISNRTAELVLLLKSKIATTDLEYGALLNGYGEYADNFTASFSSIFFVRI